MIQVDYQYNIATLNQDELRRVAIHAGVIDALLKALKGAPDKPRDIIDDTNRVHIIWDWNGNRLEDHFAIEVNEEHQHLLAVTNPRITEPLTYADLNDWTSFDHIAQGALKWRQEFLDIAESATRSTRRVVQVKQCYDPTQLDKVALARVKATAPILDAIIKDLQGALDGKPGLPVLENQGNSLSVVWHAQYPNSKRQDQIRIGISDDTIVEQHFAYICLGPSPDDPALFLRSLESLPRTPQPFPFPLLWPLELRTSDPGFPVRITEFVTKVLEDRNRPG